MLHLCTVVAVTCKHLFARDLAKHLHRSPHTISTNKPLPHSLTLLVFLAFLFVGEDKYPHNRKAPALDAFSTVHCFNYMYLLTSQNLFSALCRPGFFSPGKWKGPRHYCASHILMRCRQCQLPQLFACKYLNISGSCMGAFAPSHLWPRLIYNRAYLCTLCERAAQCCHGDSLTSYQSFTG